MKQRLIYSVLIVVLLCGNIASVYAQASSEKSTITHAEQLFAQREYEQAYGYYLKLKDLHPEEILYQYRAGVCAIYKGDPVEALNMLQVSYDKDPNLENINFFLGRAMLLNGKFDDALLQFNLQIAKETSPSDQTRLQQYVTNVVSAKELTTGSTNVVVTNAGRPLNSPGDEYAPLLTRNDSVIMYTYKGSQSVGGKAYTFGKKDSAGVYYEDIFLTMKSKGTWFTPQSVSDNLNTKSHNAVTALSPDGQTLFMYQAGLEDGGDIYVSQKAGYDWTTPIPLEGAVNTKAWEGSVALSPDGQYLYFSSTRDSSGGFGGKDLYRARRNGEGIWAFVENLGPAINTPYDDDAPSFDSTGNYLIFSSRGHNSIGGYDVFLSNLDESGQWKAPVNMGLPINSMADDIYYSLSKDGKQGIFASNRKDGNGGMDIYFAEPGLPSPQIKVKGLITLDGKPISSVVSIVYNEKTPSKSDYQLVAEDGNYTLGLPSSESYKLVFGVNGQKQYEQTYEATQIKLLAANPVNIDFYSEEYRNQHPERFEQINVSDSSSGRRELIDRGKNLYAISDSSKFYESLKLGAPVKPGYYVVVGSFQNEANAQKLEAKVAKKAKKYKKVERVINRRTGFMYVSVTHAMSKEDAVDVLMLVREDFPDAWVQYLR